MGRNPSSSELYKFSCKGDNRRKMDERIRKEWAIERLDFLQYGEGGTRSSQQGSQKYQVTGEQRGVKTFFGP